MSIGGLCGMALAVLLVIAVVLLDVVLVLVVLRLALGSGAGPVLRLGRQRGGAAAALERDAVGTIGK